MFASGENLEWMPGWELQQVNTPYGFIGLSGTRVCRQLAEDGYIDRKRDGKYAYFKINSKGLKTLEDKNTTSGQDVLGHNQEQGRLALWTLRHTV